MRIEQNSANLLDLVKQVQAATISASLPVVLPVGWTAEMSSNSRTIITAFDAEGRPVGYVTVCEGVRNFSLGITSPRRLPPGAEPTGRGWKKHLYEAAIAKLAETLRTDLEREHL